MLFWLLLCIEIIIGVILLAANKSIRFFNEYINQKFSIKISAQIIKHANDFSIEEIENAVFYNLMSRAIDETENASEIIEHLLEDIELLISIFVYSITIIIYNAWIVFLFLASLLPSVIGEYNFYLKFYKLRRNWTDNRREIDYLTWLSTIENNLKEINTTVQ